MGASSSFAKLTESVEQSRMNVIPSTGQNFATPDECCWIVAEANGFGPFLVAIRLIESTVDRIGAPLGFLKN